MKLYFDELQEVIRLNYKGLRDDDLDELYQIIEQSTVLKELSLRNNNLSLSDGKLAIAIAKNTTIKELDLSHNNISPKGVKLLADALKENNTLEDLDLNSNTRIMDEGVKCLAKMLVVNKSLQRIDLSSCYIAKSEQGSEGIKAAVIKEETGMRSIDMNNGIKDECAEKLAEAILSNHSINQLNLDFNNISEDVMDRIEEILQDPKRKIVNKENDNAEKDKKNEQNQSKALPKELKEAALKLVMKADTNKKEDELEEENKAGDIVRKEGESAIGISMKPTPEQHQQMLAAAQNTKQISSSLTNSGPNQKMPAGNNKRGTTKISAVSRAMSDDDLPDDGIVIRTPDQNQEPSSRGVRVEDALLYLDQVRIKFGDRPHIYNGFLEIMQKSKAQEMDTNELIHRIRRLFHGHIDMILGFNIFLPNGYKIEMNEGYKPPPEMKHRRESQSPNKSVLKEKEDEQKLVASMTKDDQAIAEINEDKENALLRAKLKALEEVITTKDKEIASLKESLKI